MMVSERSKLKPRARPVSAIYCSTAKLSKHATWHSEKVPMSRLGGPDLHRGGALRTKWASRAGRTKAGAPRSRRGGDGARASIR